MGRRVTTVTLACSGFLGFALLCLGWVAPRCFTTDPAVLGKLSRLLPLLAFQQPLIAMTVVTEGLLIGAGQVCWWTCGCGCGWVSGMSRARGLRGRSQGRLGNRLNAFASHDGFRCE